MGAAIGISARLASEAAAACEGAGRAAVVLRARGQHAEAAEAFEHAERHYRRFMRLWDSALAERSAERV